MSSLYPDESYCTSDIGRLLFQPKNEWAASGKVVDVIEVKQIAGTHIDYQIEIKCVPRNSIELDDRFFVLTSRFRELNRLHINLSKLHKQGYFPQFAAPRLLGSCDPAVIAERRRSIDEFLTFILDSEVLAESSGAPGMVGESRGTTKCRSCCDSKFFLYEGVNILDAPNIVDQNGDSSRVLVPESIPPPENSYTEASVGLHASASAGEFQFPDVVINTNEPAAEISHRHRRKPSMMERLFPKLSASNQYSFQMPPSVENSDYLVHAAHLVSTAQRAEHEHAYELAFPGIQHESDMSRRNAVRRKTAKYLVAAERLYRTHLAYDGAAATVNLESLVDSTMILDVLAFQCANNCLKNYRVVGVIPNLNAPKWVLKVEEKSTGRTFVMKLLEKGARTSGSRVLLPTNVPHMVQLHQFFETETFIILVLDYVECGMLWISSESERRFLLTLAASGAEVSCDVEAQQTKLDSMDCYRGRRLHFSVGVDFERVAEMRDETHSNDVPSVSGVCTMGEDATGASRAPEGDFYVIEDTGVERLSIHDEESPATVKLPCRQSDDKSSDAYKKLIRHAQRLISPTITYSNQFFFGWRPAEVVINRG
ncbi:MIT domain protein [Ostertagia ostertagi]